MTIQTENKTLAVAPLRVGLTGLRVPDPNTLVIFGATGDLTHRKLVPAIFDLFCDNKWPRSFAIVGFARRPQSDEGFRADLRAAVNEFARNKPTDASEWGNFAQRLYYHQAEFHDANGYQRLAQRLDQIDAERGTQGNRLYYLATGPEHYATIVEQLGAAKLARGEKGWRRVIIEKPFGRDLASACELNRPGHPGEPVLGLEPEDGAHALGDADHLEGHAADADLLADGIFLREEHVRDVGADEG